MNHKGIDVSEYQGNIDWRKVKDAGIEYAIIRAGFGNSASQKDKFFDKNVKNAKAAGVKIGTYWFGYARSVEEAKLEADVFAKVIAGIDFELPIFYDYEYDSFNYAKKNGVNMTKTLASDFVIAFLERMKAKGYKVGNYVTPDLIRNRFDLRINQYDTWIACYTKNLSQSVLNEKFTYQGFNVIGWQYSSEVRVNGVAGNVDANMFYLNVDATTPKKEDAGVGIVKNGSTVKVKRGVKTYTGGSLATFVYNRNHIVKEITGDRAVITYNGVVVAAVRVSDLELAK